MLREFGISQGVLSRVRREAIAAGLLDPVEHRERDYRMRSKRAWETILRGTT